MAKYRICPIGANSWKVQKRFLWIFWFDCRPTFYINRYEFISEKDAEIWIKTQELEKEFRAIERNRERERRKSIKPRIYP